MKQSNNCPQCNSTNIWIGAFPTSCNDCGWYYLNEYPCDICGKPSFSTAGCFGAGKNIIYYRCKEHPITNEEINQVFTNLFNSLDKE